MKPKKELPPRRRQPTHYPENHPAWHAAYAAFREVLPKMPEEQAKLETTHAIALRGGESLSLVLGRRVYS